MVEQDAIYSIISAAAAAAPGLSQVDKMLFFARFSCCWVS
jgi:hypothetical protein